MTNITVKNLKQNGSLLIKKLASMILQDKTKNIYICYKLATIIITNNY